MQINASSRGIKNTTIDKRSSLHKARHFCFNFINLLFWDERLSVLHALVCNSVGSLLRCHERALPRCDYWYFPLQSADGRRQPKHISASCCVGGTNGNSRQDTNSGGLHRLWSPVVRRFEPTQGIIFFYPKLQSWLQEKTVSNQITRNLHVIRIYLHVLAERCLQRSS